jgi:tetratricopeptide (TPR) repeat protein
MELVKGPPITQFCDERRLSPRERLQLFLPVCEAVQHAHQKGVIHRDLKPSNVLVALYDPGAAGVPKIIDFGIAKAAGQPLTEKTLVTGLGTVVGTPEYMSPEQAELNQLDIDTRSDIYSLGVLLYELLTGTTPLQKKRLKESALLEVLRLVREEEAQRPSNRLSTTAELTSIAANRGLEPNRLSGLLRGELDWIVMKALDKDRNRRYESASALADDVRRYLADEPVLAGPPSKTYRLRKFARKYRRSLTAIAVIAALLVAGTVTSTALASWAVRERNHADEQKRSAEVNLKRALDAVDRMLTRVGEVQLSHVPHMELVRRDLLLDALQFYQEFLREQGESPVVRWEAARAYQRVGQIQFRLGHPDESEEALGRAVGLLEKLVADAPDDPDFGDTLAAVHNDLAVLYRGSRRWAQAEAAFQEAVARREQLERQHPLHLQNRRKLAAIQGNLVAHYRQTGDLDKAETAFKKCTTILEELLAGDPKDTESRTLLARCQQNVGLVYAARDRFPEAEAAYKKALVMNEQLLRDHPDAVEVQRNLGHNYNNLGLLYWRYGQHDKAEAAYQQSLTHKEALLRNYPNVVAFMREVASSYGNIATVVRKRSPKESLDWAGRSIRILESALQEDARDVDVRMGLFDTLMGRAYAFRRLTQLEDAAKDWRRALDVSEGQPHINMRLYRPLILVFLAEHARAAAEIEVLVSEGRAQGPNLNMFAEVYSLGSAAAAKDTRIPAAEREKLADQYGGRAVELLRMARAAGYFRNPAKVANLAENKDLDAISARPDFKELLGELQKK